MCGYGSHGTFLGAHKRVFRFPISHKLINSSGVPNHLKPWALGELNMCDQDLRIFLTAAHSLDSFVKEELSMLKGSLHFLILFSALPCCLNFVLL